VKQILVGGNQDGKFKKYIWVILMKRKILFVDLGMKYEAG